MEVVSLRWRAILIRERCKRIAEAFWSKLASWMPRRLVYYCTIRLLVHATTGKYGNTVVPDLAAMDALERWHDEAVEE